jgi:hypothetical protein
MAITIKFDFLIWKQENKYIETGELSKTKILKMLKMRRRLEIARKGTFALAQNPATNINEHFCKKGLLPSSRKLGPPINCGPVVQPDRSRWSSCHRNCQVALVALYELEEQPDWRRRSLGFGKGELAVAGNSQLRE